MFKSSSKFLAIANIILAAIPLIGMFAVGYSATGVSV